jgi:hypothetical protein
MHTIVAARVGRLFSELVNVQRNSLWLPQRTRTLNLGEGYETSFDVLDLVARRHRTSAVCCGDGSSMAALTR